MSTDPLREAARALAYWERRQEVASHNVANSTTPGYKGQRVFAEVLAGMNAPALVIRDDMSDGPIMDTGRPLDVAVTGEGFLVVEAGDGELLRRGGSLSLDAAGVLVDGGGRPILGEDGVIVLPAGDIEIGRDGAIRVDGEEVARLRMERAAPADLRRVEAGLWVAGQRESLPVEARALRQGALEESNIHPLQGMVEILDVQRNYAAIQKTVVMLDDVLDMTVNRIGRVG